jgi:hypothetical protein
MAEPAACLKRSAIVNVMNIQPRSRAGGDTARSQIATFTMG